MLMRLADHENWKSLTVVLLMVEVRRPTACLLGCCHASLTAGKSCVPHNPASPLAEPWSGLSQASWTYFNISVLLVESLTSPRTFSSLQLSGTLTCAIQSNALQTLAV